MDSSGKTSRSSRMAQLLECSISLSGQEIRHMHRSESFARSWFVSSSVRADEDGRVARIAHRIKRLASEVVVVGIVVGGTAMIFSAALDESKGEGSETASANKLPRT